MTKEHVANNNIIDSIIPQPCSRELVRIAIPVLIRWANEADNLSKARSMIDYAKKESQVDRIELIRVKDNRIMRLNFRDANIVDDMRHINTDEELNNLFSKWN